MPLGDRREIVAGTALAVRYAVMDVLQLDVSGRPQAWISTREAAVLYACDSVAWTLGEACRVMRGGIQRSTGLQSRIEVHPIIAVRGVVPSRAWRTVPTLSNPKLFVRDLFICKRKPYSSIPIRNLLCARRLGQPVCSNKTIRTSMSSGAKDPRISPIRSIPRARPWPPALREHGGIYAFTKART